MGPLLQHLATAEAQRVMSLLARVAQHGECAAGLVAEGVVPVVAQGTDRKYGEAMQSASVRLLAVLASKTAATGTAVDALKQLGFFNKAQGLMTLENEAFVGNLC